MTMMMYPTLTERPVIRKPKFRIAFASSSQATTCDEHSSSFAVPRTRRARSSLKLDLELKDRDSCGCTVQWRSGGGSPVRTLVRLNHFNAEWARTLVIALVTSVLTSLTIVILVEPVKVWTQRWFKKRELRRCLYHEMVHNYTALQLQVD